MLRDATADAHRATESTPLARTLAQGTVRLEHYVALLQAYRTFWLDLEAGCEVHDLSVLLGTPRRSACAAADLQALAAPEMLPEERVRRVLEERCRATSSAGVSELLGHYYVFEGSALGGQVLAPRIRDGLGLSAGVSYLQGDGPHTRVRWLQRKEILDARLASGEALRRAVAAAERSFRDVQAVFRAIVEVS